ncbi:MAG: hypothetical protein U0269_24020 [Polyangiales bacterium]
MPAGVTQGSVVTRPPAPPTPSAAPPAGSPSMQGTGDRGSLLNQSSTKALIDLATTAKRLREEQIQAKVVYYGEGQKTNAELDAITDAVVAELQSLQLAGIKVVTQAQEAAPTTDVSIELIGTLRALLEKLFSPRREGFMRRKIEDIQRKITTLFFNSALYLKLSTQSRQALSVTYPDQAVYLAMRMHRDAILATIRSQRYSDPKVLAEAVSRFDSIEKSLRMDFLSRTTPELEALLGIYREVLLKFFFEEFKPGLGDFCWAVVKESRVGLGRPHGYKLAPEVFTSFREVFEKHFLERLVLNVQGPLVQKSSSMRGTFREETLEFVADPQIFSDVCTVVCDAIYDYLYTEGFLDLPTQWRNHLFKDRGTAG